MPETPAKKAAPAKAAAVKKAPPAPPPETERVEIVPDQVPVHEALRRVMRDVGPVGKDSRMEAGRGGSYNYRGIDAILDNTHPALVRHGVLIYPRVKRSKYATTQSSGGATMRWVRLWVNWVVIGPTGEHLKPRPQTIGEALDTSDKATNKSHTAALKVALAQVLALPYKAHDEQDEERPELGKQPQQQQQNPRSRGGQAPAPPPAWNAQQSAAAKALQDRIDHLPVAVYDRLVEKVSARAELEFANVTDLPPTWMDYLTQIVTAAEQVDPHPPPPDPAAGTVDELPPAPPPTLTAAQSDAVTKKLETMTMREVVDALTAKNLPTTGGQAGCRQRLRAAMVDDLTKAVAAGNGAPDAHDSGHVDATGDESAQDDQTPPDGPATAQTGTQGVSAHPFDSDEAAAAFLDRPESADDRPLQAVPDLDDGDHVDEEPAPRPWRQQLFDEIEAMNKPTVVEHLRKFGQPTSGLVDVLRDRLYQVAEAKEAERRAAEGIADDVDASADET